MKRDIAMPSDGDHVSTMLAYVHQICCYVWLIAEDNLSHPVPVLPKCTAENPD